MVEVCMILAALLVAAAAVGVLYCWVRSSEPEPWISESKRLRLLAAFEQARKQAKHPPEKLFVDFLANGQIQARVRPMAIYSGDAVPVLKTHVYKLEDE